MKRKKEKKEDSNCQKFSTICMFGPFPYHEIIMGMIYPIPTSLQIMHGHL